MRCHLQFVGNINRKHALRIALQDGTNLVKIGLLLGGCRRRFWLCIKQRLATFTAAKPLLSGITQAGLVNNLNDGMMWGLLPLILLSKHFTQTQIGMLTAIYPTVWGLSQLFTGKLSDKYSKRMLLFFGMLLQAVAILFLTIAETNIHFIIIGVSLGFGTALVYPTFINAIADYTHPTQRAETLGVFRLWRDLGYAIGAIITGLLADKFGISFSIMFIGILTALSAFIVLVRVKDDTNTLQYG